MAAGLFSALLLGACGGGDEGSVAPAAGSGSTAVPSSSPEEPEGTAGGSDGSSTGSYTDKYNFTATTFDGKTFELAVHKGTPVVINFWESW